MEEEGYNIQKKNLRVIYIDNKINRIPYYIDWEVTRAIDCDDLLKAYRFVHRLYSDYYAKNLKCVKSWALSVFLSIMLM